MISNNIYNFLSELQKNNTREWFQENKTLYNKAKGDFQLYIEYLIAHISEFDVDIKSITAKDSIFRIFRDVRFSSDKSPYKTNFGAYMVKNGKKSGNAGYYLHIEPGGSFIAAGSHMPPPDNLKAIRTEIYENSQEFIDILNASDFKSVFPEMVGEQLKTAPKGFDKEWEHVELLRFKSFTVWKHFTDEEILNEQFTDKVLETFKTAKPFNDFINHAIAENK